MNMNLHNNTKPQVRKFFEKAVENKTALRCLRKLDNCNSIGSSFQYVAVVKPRFSPWFTYSNSGQCDKHKDTDIDIQQQQQC